MPQVQVRCTVDNCYYWAEGNYCNADSILITSTDAAAKHSDSLQNQAMSALVNQIGETPAHHSVETACQTFRPR